ncbi:MAG TPA: response regulator transcription factor [Burkholderiales bacterium]|nr:response regulator transcription factor [Burkholderiales bacterium]
MIRIVLIDDHALVREGVARLLEEAPDMRVVGSFDDDAVAVRFAARTEPDVAILDIAMPHTSGIDVARRLRAVSPKTQLLMLSMHARAEYVQQAFWAGANGYVLKESAGEEVAAAVRAVHAGKRYLSAKIAALARGDFENEDPLERLSAREMEVLKLVVEGNTSLEVATRLGVSPKSIDTYRSRLMTKLDLEHLPALVKFAIRRGLTSA